MLPTPEGACSSRRRWPWRQPPSMLTRLERSFLADSCARYHSPSLYRTLHDLERLRRIETCGHQHVASMCMASTSACAPPGCTGIEAPSPVAGVAQHSHEASLFHGSPALAVIHRECVLVHLRFATARALPLWAASVRLLLQLTNGKLGTHEKVCFSLFDAAMTGNCCGREGPRTEEWGRLRKRMLGRSQKSNSRIRSNPLQFPAPTEPGSWLRSGTPQRAAWCSLPRQHHQAGKCLSSCPQHSVVIAWHIWNGARLR